MQRFTFQITYDDAVSTICLSENHSLEDLAKTITESIGFDFDHAYGFYSSLHGPSQECEHYTLFADLPDGEDEVGGSVKKTMIEDVFHEGRQMLFFFDYGDDWRFLLTCTGVSESKTKRPCRQILSTKGTFPEQYPDFDDEEEDEFEVMSKRVKKKNTQYLNGFYKYLIEEKKLNEKTASKHASNIEFFGNSYVLCYEGEPLDKAILEIDEFLGSWFIRKCMWSTPTAIKQYITSFKKFYRWMLDNKHIDKEDYAELLLIIKEEQENWLDRCQKFNSPDCDIEDIFPW
jgi:hypothetical protein